MPRNDDDNPEFRLRPRKPPIPREQRAAPVWSLAFRTVLKYARSSRVGKRLGVDRPRPAHFQHCSVRVTYSGNRVAGHWRAHARYIARESASLQPEKSGFTAEATGVDVAGKLDSWQKSADPRLWRLIISPEFGERVDLEHLARDVIERMETDLHRSLEWIAVAHFNTEHPHVHVALRGLDRTGEEFRLDRDYVCNGLRSVAQHFATVQLGYRTEQDAADALRRLILARSQSTPDFPGCLQVAADASRPGPGRFAAVREQSITARLMTLETMGLARADGSHRWLVRTDLELVLRAMQRAADHQKTLAVNGAVLSDPRLRLCAPSWKEINSLPGRVLSHGEEEAGNRYFLLESTDGRVYYLRHTPELD